MDPPAGQGAGIIRRRPDGPWVAPVAKAGWGLSLEGQRTIDAEREPSAERNGQLYLSIGCVDSRQLIIVSGLSRAKYIGQWGGSAPRWHMEGGKEERGQEFRVTVRGE